MRTHLSGRPSKSILVGPGEFLTKEGTELRVMHSQDSPELYGQAVSSADMLESLGVPDVFADGERAY